MKAAKKAVLCPAAFSIRQGLNQTLTSDRPMQEGQANDVPAVFICLSVQCAMLQQWYLQCVTSLQTPITCRESTNLLPAGMPLLGPPAAATFPSGAI